MTNSSNNRVTSLSLTPPSLKNNTADADRLTGALKKQLKIDHVHVDLPLLRTLPGILRESDYHIRCVIFKERERYTLLGVLPAGSPQIPLGLAVDLGTTRIVLRLINLEDGEALGESSFDNPQIEVAPDVLDRIHYTDEEGGLEHLQTMVTDGLNRAMNELCQSLNQATENIYLITVAGNTAMTHLFMGVTPYWVIREPYIPAMNTIDVLKADELNITANPQTRLLVFPNVGSYFGGDLIAGILYSGMNEMEEIAILVDVGTNAEVILGNKDWLIACAGAAGPALEGGVSRMGMMAGPGVIETVRVNPETREFEYESIGGLPPKGMCGSGIIDLAAHLFLSGMLDIRGKLSPEKCGKHYRETDGMGQVVVVPTEQSATGKALTISQADIDSLIRSKAAMYTILETITRSVGMTPKDLTRFYVAGTFGSFIKPQSAIAIGMIPDLPLECYTTLGNSSLGGATLALTMEDCLEKMDNIRSRITYLELNVNQELMIRFSASRFLPHTEPSLFPSVKVWG